MALTTTNTGARRVLRNVRAAGEASWISLSSDEPLSLADPAHHALLTREWREANLNEISSELRREGNFELNFLLLMGLAGVIAVVGLWTNTVHIVIGAMVLAPGFEPLLRIPFGLIAGPRDSWTRGAAAAVAGYLILMAAAAGTLLALRTLDPTGPSDLEARSWVRYWSTLTPPGALLSIVAALAGAITITANRAVFTVGVMIALALIPSSAIAGMAVAAGDWQLAAEGIGRWSVDVGAVAVMGFLVIGGKQWAVHRHRAEA